MEGESRKEEEEERVGERRRVRERERTERLEISGSKKQLNERR